MGSYIVRRLALIVPTLLLVTIIVFFSIRMIPGNAIDIMIAERGTEMGVGTDVAKIRQAIEARLGWDKPVPVQYILWLGDIVINGSLGNSLWTDLPVTKELARRLPVSFELGALACIIGLILAVPVGIYSAIRQDSVGDYVTRSVAIAFVTLPSFWLGTLVMIIPSALWDWTPRLTYVAFFKNPAQNLEILAVPAILLGMFLSGATMRMTRTMMLEVLRQDYIRTAWAKGLKEKVVVLRHAIKNALIPVITVIGLQVPILFGGSIVLEQIFNIPGIGRLTVQVLNTRDYPMLSGINLSMAAIVLFFNLIVDLTYSFLDPRIRYR